MASSSEERLPDEKAVKKAEKLKTEGNQLLKKGEYDAAIESYSAAIQLDPKNPAHYSNRAAVYLKMGNNESAITDCRTALDLNPHHSKTLCRLGVALMNVERKKEAKECFEAAVRIQPGNSTYKHNLSLCEECLEKGPAKDDESDSAYSVAASGPQLTPDRSSEDEYHSPQLVTTDFPSFVQPHLESTANTAAAPDLGTLMNDPMFLRITQSILSSETIVNAIRQQAEEVRNLSGTDAHDQLGNTRDGLDGEPFDPSGPLRSLQEMVDRQRDANTGRPSQGGGGKAPPPPGGPPGPPAPPSTGNQDTTQGKKRRTRPSADQSGRGKSQSSDQPANNRPGEIPPPPGALTPAPTGDNPMMPPMEEIDLEELLNDPVVIQTANRILANPDIQRLLTEIMLTMLEAPLMMPPANFIEIMEQQAREEQGQQPGQPGAPGTLGGPTQQGTGPLGASGPDQPQSQSDQSPGLPIGARFIFITTSGLDPDFEPMMPPTGGLGPLPPGGLQNSDGPRRPDPQQRTVEDVMRRIQIESGHGLMSNPEQQAAEAARQRNMLGQSSSGSISSGRRPDNRPLEPGTSANRPAIGPPPAGGFGATQGPPTQPSTEKKDKEKKKSPPEAIHAAPAVVDEDFSGLPSPRQSAQGATKLQASEKKQEEGQKKSSDQKEPEKKPPKRPSKDHQ